jgi:hypothetical protein
MQSLNEYKGKSHLGSQAVGWNVGMLLNAFTYEFKAFYDDSVMSFRKKIMRGRYYAPK